MPCVCPSALGEALHASVTPAFLVRGSGNDSVLTGALLAAVGRLGKREWCEARPAGLRARQ